MAKKKLRPLWEGPDGEGPNGGVTVSLLSRFLCCPERFRLLVVEGLRPAEAFNHRIEYGQMWHLCEEGYSTDRKSDLWVGMLRDYCRNLCRRYPTQQEQIQHWYNVCCTQFPIYLDYWAKHADEKGRTSLLREQVFDVPYRLGSGRMVRLRGKWDGVDLIGKGKGAGVYLREHKTKGDIKEEMLRRQLYFDLQTMTYVMVMDHWPAKDWREKPIKGIIYNVVRRPLSGGKGSIRKHQATKTKPEETEEEFYARVGGIISEDPGHFFMRWRVELTPGDVLRFRRECLDPLLERLCDWWEWIKENPRDPWTPEGADSVNRLHFRYPFGIFNALTEGGASEMDEYLASGSQVGLTQASTLFRELE